VLELLFGIVALAALAAASSFNREPAQAPGNRTFRALLSPKERSGCWRSALTHQP